MDPDDAATAGHTEGDGGEGGVLTRLDRQTEKVAEEALVRGRQEQGLSHRRETVGRAEEFERLRRRLAEVESHVEKHSCPRDPGHEGHLEAVGEEVLDCRDDVVGGVVGIGVVDAGSQADVGRDDRRAAARRRRQVLRVGEAADVVAEDRPGPVRRVGDRGAPGVDRDRDVESLRDRLDGRDDAVEFLSHGDEVPGTGLDATDVDDVGTIGDESLGPAQRAVELEGRAVVVERIRRAIDDPHDEHARGDVVAARPELNDGRRRRSHDARALGRACHVRSEQLRGEHPPVPVPAWVGGVHRLEEVEVLAPGVRIGLHPGEQAVEARLQRFRRRPRPRLGESCRCGDSAGPFGLGDPAERGRAPRRTRHGR